MVKRVSAAVGTLCDAINKQNAHGVSKARVNQPARDLVLIVADLDSALIHNGAAASLRSKTGFVPFHTCITIHLTAMCVTLSSELHWPSWSAVARAPPISHGCTARVRLLENIFQMQFVKRLFQLVSAVLFRSGQARC